MESTKPTNREINVLQELMRPLLTKRAGLIFAMGLPLVAAANLVLLWATDHYSSSAAVFFALVGLSGPVVVLVRFLITGTLDASPRSQQ